MSLISFPPTLLSVIIIITQLNKQRKQNLMTRPATLSSNFSVMSLLSGIVFCLSNPTSDVCFSGKKEQLHNKIWSELIRGGDKFHSIDAFQLICYYHV